MSLVKKIYVNGCDEEKFFKQLEERNGETDKKVTAVVSEIIDDVKKNGDKAVKKYTEKFDGKLPEYYDRIDEMIRDWKEEYRQQISI